MSQPRPSVELLRVDELDRSLLDEWRRQRSADPTLASPFFDPAFTLAVGTTDEVPVRVIVIAGRTFWPVQFRADGGAGPVGAMLGDHQGIIGRLPSGRDAIAVLRAVGIRSYRFDHVPTAQTDLLARARRAPDDASPVLDLTGGLDAYEAAVRASGSELINQTRNRRRRIERDIGPVRFTEHSTDRSDVEALARWKSAQYQATGVPDLFRAGWTARAIDRLRQTDADGCRARVSTLHAGDRLIAVHLGLRSVDEWHWWLPAYDATLGSRYSAGIQILLAMAEAAPDLGVRRIDLGKGPETYKRRAATAEVGLARGVVEPPSLAVGVRRAKALARRLRA